MAFTGSQLAEVEEFAFSVPPPLPIPSSYGCCGAAVLCVAVQVCRQLVRPLLAMSRVLHRQVEELSGLLVRKDAEILDYKENGAVLTRGAHLYTHTHVHACTVFTHLHMC